MALNSMVNRKTVTKVPGATSTATATKTSFENKRMENGGYFVMIASFSHHLLLTEHAENGLVEAPLK